MKFSKLHHHVWRSLLACGLLSFSFLAGQSFAPVDRAGASSANYSRVDKHCISAIDRSITISQPTAAQILAMPPGTPISTVTALTGTQPYCQIADKTAPSGVMSKAYVLPIHVDTIVSPPNVLIVYVVNDAELSGHEVWNVAPPDWLEQQTEPPLQQTARSTWNNVTEAWQDRHQRNQDLPALPSEPAMPPQQLANCPPCSCRGTQP